MAPQFTIAVVGHNEAPTVDIALSFAFAAAKPGDSVWFVDSASTDGSPEIAESLGAHVVSAPLGKGHAVASALAQCQDAYFCFFDADLKEAESDFTTRLRDTAVTNELDMVVGSYREPNRRLSVTPAVYVPLVGALFPEALAQDIAVPLSGFRVLRTGLELGVIPPGFGLETHLNLQMHLLGARVATCDVGSFVGNLRGYSNIAQISADVAAAVLDLAEAHGRLDPACRPLWDGWVADAVELFRDQPPPGADDAEYLRELTRLAARPLPPRAGVPGR
jgi:hypothetical protein